MSILEEGLQPTASLISYKVTLKTQRSRNRLPDAIVVLDDAMVNEALTSAIAEAILVGAVIMVPSEVDVLGFIN